MQNARTLYDPTTDHDACGVGLFCRVDGTPSHHVVEKGLFTLVELDHRGACGCDEETGDGAGILIQIPHAFFAAEVQGLPAPGDYAVAPNSERARYSYRQNARIAESFCSKPSPTRRGSQSSRGAACQLAET